MNNFKDVSLNEDFTAKEMKRSAPEIIKMSRSIQKEDVGSESHDKQWKEWNAKPLHSQRSFHVYHPSFRYERTSWSRNEYSGTAIFIWITSDTPTLCLIAEPHVSWTGFTFISYGYDDYSKTYISEYFEGEVYSRNWRSQRIPRWTTKVSGISYCSLESLQKMKRKNKEEEICRRMKWKTT